MDAALKLLTLAIVLCSLVGFVSLHGNYRNFIPNGFNVPNSCTDNATDVWSRVGHTWLDHNNQPTGNKSKNAFGQAFLSLRDAHGLTGLWNGTAGSGLCYQDSDGDGRTNGEELGDSNCVWTFGSTPATTTLSQLSHPGIPDEIGGSMTQANRTIYCLD